MHIHAYLYFPEKIENLITSVEEGKKLLEEFQMTLDLIDCERDSILFYSASNKDLFVENVNLCEEVFESNFVGNYSFETTIDILLDFPDIKKIKDEKKLKCSYLTYNSNTKETDKNSPIIFQTIAQHKELLVEPQKQILLNFFNEYFSQNPIAIIIDCVDQEKKIISVPFISEFSELDLWLQENRLIRTFNNTDERHIVGNPIYHSQRKSPLLGGIAGRPRAAELLKTALGDKRKNDHINDLVNFDDEKGEYIFYKYEGENPQNQYHAFHLVTHSNHQKRDKRTVGTIPKRVLKIIEYRKSLK